MTECKVRLIRKICKSNKKSLSDERISVWLAFVLTMALSSFVSFIPSHNEAGWMPIRHKGCIFVKQMRSIQTLKQILKIHLILTAAVS